MKKILAILLSVLMCVFISQKGFAVNSWDNMSLEETMALQLKELGLIQGAGKNKDGSPDFQLNRPLNRVEALTLLVRTLGKGAAAEAYPKTHPFSDVPSWADGIVSYAYDNGLIKGVSATLFDANSEMSAAMYLTLMLRVLGYADGSDYNMDSPYALAAWCGILPPQMDRVNFLRADAIAVTSAAMYAHIKGTQTTLHERLASEGVFTAEQFNAVFPVDPFEDYRLIDKQIAETIASHKALGRLDNGKYAVENHIILNMSEIGDTLRVPAWVFYGYSTINKDKTVSDTDGWGEPWLIELDAKTFECKSYRTESKMLEDGISFSDYFPDDYISVTVGSISVCHMQTQLMVDAGLIKHELTYEQALAVALTNFNVEQTIETEQCTILLGGITGTPHIGQICLYLIYKNGSDVGEGETVSLPIPNYSFYSATIPDNLWLSEDGMMLYYTYHFDEQASYVVEIEPIIIHEAGTYNYTTSLTTGETSLTITY